MLFFNKLYIPYIYRYHGKQSLLPWFSFLLSAVFLLKKRVTPITKWNSTESVHTNELCQKTNNTNILPSLQVIIFSINDPIENCGGELWVYVLTRMMSTRDWSLVSGSLSSQISGWYLLMSTWWTDIHVTLPSSGQNGHIKPFCGLTTHKMKGVDQVLLHLGLWLLFVWMYQAAVGRTQLS